MKNYVAPIIMGLALLNSQVFASGKVDIGEAVTQPSLSIPYVSVDQFNQHALRKARRAIREGIAERMSAKVMEIRGKCDSLEGESDDECIDGKSKAEWEKDFMESSAALSSISHAGATGELNEIVILSLLTGKGQSYFTYDVGAGVMENLNKAGITFLSLCDELAGERVRDMKAGELLTDVHRIRKKARSLSPIEGWNTELWSLFDKKRGADYLLKISPIAWQKFNHFRLDKARVVLIRTMLENLEADKRELLKAKEKFIVATSLVSEDEKNKLQKGTLEELEKEYKGEIYTFDRHTFNNDIVGFYDEQLARIATVRNRLTQSTSRRELNSLIVVSLLTGTVQRYMGLDLSSGVGRALYLADITLHSLLTKD